jgi:hypothetical protein
LEAENDRRKVERCRGENVGEEEKKEIQVSSMWEYPTVQYAPLVVNFRTRKKRGSMLTETRTTDGKARLILPKSFANATVIVEQVSDSELRVRRARVVPEDEMPFAEELRVPLSDRDRDRFLDLLAKPPAPNAALKAAAARHKARRG